VTTVPEWFLSGFDSLTGITDTQAVKLARKQERKERNMTNNMTDMATNFLTIVTDAEKADMANQISRFIMPIQGTVIDIAVAMFEDLRQDINEAMECYPAYGGNPHYHALDRLHSALKSTSERLQEWQTLVQEVGT
jgi:hypothetical protein